jgi:MYXO-CTERM domain-containing protein
MNTTLAFGTLLLLGATAHAQAGLCSGQLAGTVGLTLTSGAQLVEVPPADLRYLFNAAECQCASADATSNDINVSIKLTQQLPIGTPGTVEVWVGNGCDNYTVRTVPNQNVCERVAALDITRFSVGNTGDPILVPLAVKSLFSPLYHRCDDDFLMSNSVYVLLFTNPETLFASCTLDLEESTRHPVPATNVTAQINAAGIATLHWTAPPDGLDSPFAYQVLCSPSEMLAQPALFSTCDAGQLHRRALANVPSTMVGGEACSSMIAGTADSATIGPITHATQIQIAAIDRFGNATLSPAVSVTPLPSQPQLASHGCSVAGNGAAPPWALLMLVSLVAAVLRRRGRSRA